jgi:hypothetical protein
MNSAATTAFLMFGGEEIIGIFPHKNITQHIFCLLTVL